MTTLTLKHIAETTESTVSELTQGDRHLCYIIEDGYREVKVWGETRIYPGTYKIFPRKSGGFFSRYKARFKHGFVLGLKDVPQFTWILIHIGNSAKNTHGCLLTNTEYYKGSDGHYWGAGSTDAYLKLHALFELWFEKGPVEIVIDRGIVPEQPEPERPEPEEPEPEQPEPPPLNERNGCFPPFAPRPLSLVSAGDYDGWQDYPEPWASWVIITFVIVACLVIAGLVIFGIYKSFIP